LTPLHYTKEEVALLTSTPLYGHAIESRRNGRKSCLKAVQWLQSLPCQSSDHPLDHLSEMLEIPQELLFQDESDANMDISREAQNWGKDEEQWLALKVWRWAETAYGR
jgi:TorA maturation chaperone TorD